MVPDPSLVRRVVERARTRARDLPAPVADRLRAASQATSTRRRDRHRAAFANDAEYFSHLCAVAIAEAEAT